MDPWWIVWLLNMTIYKSKENITSILIFVVRQGGRQELNILTRPLLQKYSTDASEKKNSTWIGLLFQIFNIIYICRYACL